MNIYYEEIIKTCPLNRVLEIARLAADRDEPVTEREPDTDRNTVPSSPMAIVAPTMRSAA